MYKKTKILALFIAIGAVLVTGLVSIPVLPSYAVDMDNEGGGSAPAEPKDENEQEDETKDSTQQKETNNIDNRINEPFNPNDFNQDNDVTNEPFNTYEPFNAQELEQNFEDTIKNTNTNDNKLSPDECKKRGIIDGGESRFDNINLNECMAGLGTEGVGEYIGAYIAGCMDSGRDILSCQNDVKPVISASAPKSD